MATNVTTAGVAPGIVPQCDTLEARIAMMWVSHRSDHKRERRWHLSIPGVLGAVGLALSTAFSGVIAASMTIASLLVFRVPAPLVNK